MTTAIAERAYLAEHERQMEGKKWAVYNPKNVDVSELPFIYGFNNGGAGSFLSAVLLAEDGKGLGGHCCSHEGYMLGDLGILEGTRSDRHETFKEHYPDGYRMFFVTGKDVAAKSNAGLEEAYRLNQILAKEAEEKA